MLCDADKPRLQHRATSGKLKTDTRGITLYSGGNYSFFESLTATLSAMLGEPKSDKKQMTPQNELEGRSIMFEGGIGIVYLLFRSNGISITIPHEAKKMLLEKLSNIPQTPDALGV